MVNRSTRSSKYQHLFAEKSFPTEVLDGFEASDSIYKRLNPFDYNEQVIELQDQLKDRFMELIKTHLTNRQLEIVLLLMSGLGQAEVAKKIHCNQSSVTKSLNGNVDYSDNSRRSYGGVIRKLRRIADEDPEVKEILEKISDLRGENWL